MFNILSWKSYTSRSTVPVANENFSLMFTNKSWFSSRCEKTGVPDKYDADDREKRPGNTRNSCSFLRAIKQNSNYKLFDWSKTNGIRYQWLADWVTQKRANRRRLGINKFYPIVWTIAGVFFVKARILKKSIIICQVYEQ